VSYGLRRAKVYTGFYAQVSYVVLQGLGFAVQVRGEDWKKILPYLADGSFSPTPTDTAFSNGGVNSITPDTPVESYAPSYYNRVLARLEVLFPLDYPTSNL
jgi:hypothetical protein